MDDLQGRAVSQFFDVVPSILTKLGRSYSIVFTEKTEEFKDCGVPDLGLPKYLITFTIGENLSDRMKPSPLLYIEKKINDEGLEIEVCYNRLYGSRDINIKLDYKTEEQWYEIMKFAFEIYDNKNNYIMNNLIDLFREVKECDYKGEHYSVRDNGAVMRHPKKHNHLRPLDNLWTFGKKNENNGYMFIGGVRVHQIVATAFHGIPEDKNMVVDHKDTNRCNNRPENLHWITRLENVLNNPITRAKIEFICGSIEKFIENPSILRFYENENPNFHWMRSVTLEEAKISYDRWMSWANNPTKHIVKEKSNIDDWLYQQPDQNRTEYLMKNWRAESRSKNKKN